MRRSDGRRRARVLSLSLAAFSVVLLLLLPSNLFGQASVSTTTVQGTVTDQSGAALPNASVTITNTATGSARTLATNNSGVYNSGSLPPGNYKVHVAAPNFQAYETSVVAQVGNVSTVNVKMIVGSEKQTINVEATSVAVNTDQSSVQGVLTGTQIDQLPVNGRNFLDLAQLEPRSVTSRSRLAAASAVPPAFRLTVWTSPTRPSAPPPATFLPVPFRNSS